MFFDLKIRDVTPSGGNTGILGFTDHLHALKPIKHTKGKGKGKAVAQWVSVLIFKSEDSKFKSHCSQHVVVSLGKTLHPKLLLWGLPTVLNVCKSLWIKASNK